jgi:hypothetical protein
MMGMTDDCGLPKVILRKCSVADHGHGAISDEITLHPSLA